MRIAGLRATKLGRNFATPPSWWCCGGTRMLRAACADACAAEAAPLPARMCCSHRALLVSCMLAFRVGTFQIHCASFACMGRAEHARCAS